MKKVLVLANHVLGIYSFRKELINRLIDEGYEVYISAPTHEKMSYFTQIGCKCIEVNLERRGKNPISDIKLFIRYFKIVMQIRPAVVLTYTIKPNIYGGIVSRIFRKPYIANITGLGSAVENEGLLQKITLFLYKFSLKKANRVFFQNEENLKFLKKYNVVKSNYKLIPGSGVNLNQYKMLEYPKNHNKVQFVFIARVMKEKGIDQYLEAAEYIKAKYPDTVFHILGNCEESYIEKLKEKEKKGVIIYHGRQNDVRKFHEFSHCTIHPTYYPEGMSNVLLESAACGRPIITTDRAGCREIVDIGKSGLLVKEKNSSDLIKKIEQFLELDNNTKKMMGLAGRKKVEREFDREIVIREYINEISNYS